MSQAYWDGQHRRTGPFICGDEDVARWARAMRLQPGSKVLDIGAGMSYTPRMLKQELGLDVTVADTSRVSQRFQAHHGIELASQFDLDRRCGFDAVVDAGVLTCMPPEPREAHMRRLLTDSQPKFWFSKVISAKPTPFLLNEDSDPAKPQVVWVIDPDAFVTEAASLSNGTYKFEVKYHTLRETPTYSQGFYIIYGTRK